MRAFQPELRSAPAFDEAHVQDVYRRLADCIERIGALDRAKEIRAVQQALALLWAAQDTLDGLTGPRRHT